jgi:hypothetical protein
MVSLIFHLKSFHLNKKLTGKEEHGILKTAFKLSNLSKHDQNSELVFRKLYIQLYSKPC